MVLILDKKQQETFPLSTQKLVKSFPVYQDAVKTFFSLERKYVRPKGLLYVAQREFAVLRSNDRNVSIIGSGDATTCIIAILRHSISGATAVAHFDSTDLDEVIQKIVNQIKHLSSKQSDGRIELHLIGGYSDEKSISEDIYLNALDIFHSLPNEIELRLACVGHLNTVFQNGVRRPIIYGAGVDLETGEVFPVTFFTEKGPYQDLRHARLYSSRSFVDIYNVVTGLLTIKPFSYNHDVRIDFLLSQDDNTLLKYSSSSPLVEPPDFLLQTRRALKFMKYTPDLSTVFKGNKPLYFRRSGDRSSWTHLM